MLPSHRPRQTALTSIRKDFGFVKAYFKNFWFFLKIHHRPPEEPSKPPGQPLELGLEFLRQGAGELHGFSGAGVDEPQARGVEALALEAGSGLPIDRVPQDGTA